MADSKVPPFQSYASHSPNSSPRTPGKMLYIILFILLLVVIGIGAAQFISSRSNDLDSTIPAPIEFEEPTPAPLEEEPAEPTAAAEELDRSELSVVIHNGSGAAGVAGTASDILEDLGYTVQSTGNADNFDYTETVIRVSADNKEYLELLEKDLSEEYTIGETSATYTGAGDALIIIGAE